MRIPVVDEQKRLELLGLSVLMVGAMSLTAQYTGC
jgi:hypothetical protein